MALRGTELLLMPVLRHATQISSFLSHRPLINIRRRLLQPHSQPASFYTPTPMVTGPTMVPNHAGNTPSMCVD